MFTLILTFLWLRCGCCVLCMGKVPFTRLTNEILYFSLPFIKSFSVLSFQWWLFLDNVLHLMDDAQWSMNTRWKIALRNYSIKTSKVCHKVHKSFHSFAALLDVAWKEESLYMLQYNFYASIARIYITDYAYCHLSMSMRIFKKIFVYFQIQNAWCTSK